MGIINSLRTGAASLATILALATPVAAQTRPIDRSHGTLSSLIIPSKPSQYHGFLELEGEVIGPRFGKLSVGVDGFVSLANVVPYNNEFFVLDIRTSTMGHYQLTPNLSVSAGIGVQSFLAMQDLTVTVKAKVEVNTNNPIIKQFFENFTINTPLDCTCGAADWRYGAILGVAYEEGRSRFEWKHFSPRGGDELFGYKADQLQLVLSPSMVPLRFRGQIDRTVPSRNQTFVPTLTAILQVRSDFPGTLSASNPWPLLNYLSLEAGQRSVLEPLPSHVQLEDVETINNKTIQYIGFGVQLPLGNGHREH